MSKEKNAQIKATLLATKERRKTQKCFAFSTKIDYRKLNKLQEVHNEIKVWDRVFRCDCGVCMDRDVHAAQCMVWMFLNNFQNSYGT